MNHNPTFADDVHAQDATETLAESPGLWHRGRMGQRASATPRNPPVGPALPLAEAVHRLTDELGALRSVLDEIREDFSWVVRNGLPVRPLEHAHVRRMALDPLSDDWGDRLEIERTIHPSRGVASPLESAALDAIVSDLQTAFEAATQEHLNLVLTAVDHVRDEILAALRNRPTAPPVSERCPAAETTVRSDQETSRAEDSGLATAEAQERPGPGCLF